MTYLANFASALHVSLLRSTSAKAVSSGLFDSIVGYQQSMQNQSAIFSSGNSIVLPIMAIKSDGDVNFPICSMTVTDATSQDARAGSQIGSSNFTSQRAYTTNNKFFVSNKMISLTNTILDSGDLVQASEFNIFIIPIKEQA
jgi:hypothetical protein